MPSATLRQIQGEALHPHAMGDTALACFGRILWIDSQGARQARVDDDGDSDDNDANDNDGGNGDNNDGEVEHNSGDDDDNDNDDDVNIDVVEDDNDDGTSTMRWRRGRMGDNNAMAMGGQRHAERSRAPRHPSKATINLC